MAVLMKCIDDLPAFGTLKAKLFLAGFFLLFLLLFTFWRSCLAWAKSLPGSGDDPFACLEVEASACQLPSGSVKLIRHGNGPATPVRRKQVAPAAWRECLRHARELEEAHAGAEANLPQVDEAAMVPVALHESLLPGSVLTTLFRNPAKTSRTVAFKREELSDLDGMTSDYLLNYYQSQSLFTAKMTPARLRTCLDGSMRRLHQLLRHSGLAHGRRSGWYDAAHE